MNKTSILFLFILITLSACREPCETRAIGHVQLLNLHNEELKVLIYEQKRWDSERKAIYDNIFLEPGDKQDIEVQLRNSTFEIVYATGAGSDSIVDERLDLFYCDTLFYSLN